MTYTAEKRVLEIFAKRYGESGQYYANWALALATDRRFHQKLEDWLMGLVKTGQLESDEAAEVNKLLTSPE